MTRRLLTINLLCLEPALLTAAQNIMAILSALSSMSFSYLLEEKKTHSLRVQSEKNNLRGSAPSLMH